MGTMLIIVVGSFSWIFIQDFVKKSSKYPEPPQQLQPQGHYNGEVGATKIDVVLLPGCLGADYIRDLYGFCDVRNPCEKFPKQSRASSSTWSLRRRRSWCNQN
ncbi:hypothetical protein PIB30_005078 [Stylosanthes scabra]|uniref:Uncharacterized protein n=1 Tax=Stylosanthes scabra TaxID=79078 RepID=A0ABU6Z117_9FABA|nr:hypothetical protein [Stylosanthes scabra]